jgi:hypothetical protein
LLFGSPTNYWAISLGSVGAMLPDPLRFVHARLPHEPLRTLQRFHRWAHTKKRIKGAILGIGSQAAFVLFVVAMATVIHHGAFDSAFAMVRGGK